MGSSGREPLRRGRRGDKRRGTGGREAPERLQLKMWLYPYLTILTIVLFVAVIASMGIIAQTRMQLALSLLSAGLVLGAYFVFRRGRSGGGSGPDATRTADARAGSAER